MDQFENEMLPEKVQHLVSHYISMNLNTVLSYKVSIWKNKGVLVEFFIIIKKK